MRKHMVESEELKMQGLRSKALQDKDENVFLLKDDWHRICAPAGNKPERMHSLIFWNKANPEDSESMWKKVVRNYCYCCSFLIIMFAWLDWSHCVQSIWVEQDVL
jgi:hypothetical protein